MAYFNHAFNKTFIADSTLATAGTATSALTAGQVALVSDATWASVALPGAPGIGALGYVVQGSFYTKDTIGNNPGHGGYQESVKSKGINPRYITRLWQANCQTATQATASLSLGSACAPCGKTQFMRIDVKGSPALRFLNHNAYAIADSANVCCIDGQEYIDPTLILGVMAEMALGDPLIKPFVGDVLTVVDSGSTTDATLTITALTAGGVITNSTNAAGAVTQGVYTIAQAQGKATSGNYVPSTDPNGTDKVSATVEFVGAYVDTVFGNCSFDTRDHYNAEPVEIIVSELDETGNPCNDCGVATQTPGSMQQTQGEEVVRELIMSERYRQSPYNQGNKDSARFREIEMSDELLSSVDRSATYKGYYIQHSVPRFNNPSGVFDNDQYVYKVYVKCSDAAAQLEVEKLMDALAAWATANGNALAVEENAYW